MDHEQPTPQPTPNLNAAWSAARLEMAVPTKTGFNKFDDYSYATAGDIAIVVVPAMAKHGLSIHTTCDEKRDLPERKTRNGGTEYVTEVRLICTLKHASGEEWEPITVYGTGQDRSDKALPKAITSAQKIAFQQLFWIPATDDPEATSDGRNEPPPSDRKPSGRQSTRPSTDGKTGGKSPTTTPPSDGQGSQPPKKGDFDGAKKHIANSTDSAKLLAWRNALPTRGFDSEQQEELARLIDEKRCRLKIQHIGTLDNAAQFKACLAALPSEGFTPEHRAMLEELLTDKIHVAESWENANAQTGQGEGE
jgi:hypothetical protein